MYNNPKVSIITVSRNAAPFIERTIQSVLEQSYKPVEYIVIDGASADGTVDIIKKYEHELHHWESAPDKSHFDAMNKGLAQATGAYVLFMNAGDKIANPHALKNMMEGHADADLIYGRALYTDEFRATRPWHKETPLPGHLSDRSFLNGMVICHHCMVVKTSIAPPYQLGPWKIANDIDWAIRVMKNVRSAHFNDDVFCLYLEGGLSAKHRLQAVRERFSICVKHFGLVPTIGQQFKILFGIIKRRRIS